MDLLLASTSALYGEGYLKYLEKQITALFAGVEKITFIPYARPDGISHDAYTQKARDFFSRLGIGVQGLHSFADPMAALQGSAGFFTGGGNTFLLVKALHGAALMDVLKDEIKKGKPYLGTSAGTNIAGINMKTTNDMPIVYPPSFDCMGLVPFNINPHYLDPDPSLKHNGETRETRIKEFLAQNDVPVVGLREGNWIRATGNRITVEGIRPTRIFLKDRDPFEIAAGTDIPSVL